MNINQILKKNLEALNEEEQKDVTDALCERYFIEHKKNDKSGIYGFTQYKMAYHSNKMEGSTLTENQTKNLFDTGTLPSSPDVYRAKDVEEATGHFLMFNEMLHSCKEPLSETIIKKFHYRLKAGVFEDQANGYLCGEYKNRVNGVGNIVTAKPYEVPQKMKELFAWYDEQPKNLETFVNFHARYEQIHPFQDGNGRTGRMILFRECLNHGVIPSFIRKEVEFAYKQAIGKAQTTGEYEDLMRIFREGQSSFYKTIQEFLYVHEINIDPETKLIETEEGLFSVAEIKKMALKGNPPKLMREEDRVFLSKKTDKEYGE